VDFFITVKDTNNSGIDRVYLQLEEEEFEMERFHDPDIGNWSEGILFHAKVKIELDGEINLTFNTRSGNGSLENSDLITMTVEGREEVDTILGLPKTYCAISVIFITLIIIFLTWSYFKGKKMQKELEHDTGASKMACSACGAGISIEDEKCPKCGAVFEEEEHICGNCGKIISENDTKCSKCGTKLKVPEDIPKEQNRSKIEPDLKKLKKKIDMSGKVNCISCNTIFLEKEGKCPQCNKKI